MSLSSGSSNSSASSQGSPYTRGIRIRRYAQTRYVENLIDGYRFRVVAYGAYLMDKEIFRFLRRPSNVQSGLEVDEYDGVCSPADMEEYPVGEPDGSPAFSRGDEVDMIFRSQSEADEAWTAMREEIANLVNTLDIMDRLETAEDLSYGDPPPADPP